MKNIKNVFIVFVFGMLVIGISLTKMSPQEIIKPEITLNSNYVPLFDNLEPHITEDKVAMVLEKYNVRFPGVVLAQAIHESGRFTSNIYIKNNNLFGLKVPSSRPTTALGTINGHAYYQNWEMSVLDYALYQAAFTRKIKKESNYLRYLNRNYAADPNYEAKLRRYLPETNPKFK